MKTPKNLLIPLALIGFLSFILPRSAAADFKQGYEVFLKKDYANAASLLSAIRVPKGEGLLDYYLWALGCSLIEKGEFAAGQKNLEELIKVEPESLLVNAARVQIGRALQAEGQSPKAKEYLNPLLATLDGDLKGEALYYLALAEADTGAKDAALGHLKQSYFEFPNAATSDQVPILWQKLSGTTFPTGLPVEQMDRANRLFENKNYPKALESYVGLNDDSDPARRDLARVRRGECLYALKRYGDAELYLNPGPTVGADIAWIALLHFGMSQLRNGKEAAAISTFEDLQRRYPGTVEGEEALYREGMIAFQAVRLAEATGVFQRLIQGYPHGNFRDKGAWSAAWAAYRHSDFAAALQWLKSLDQGATDAATHGKALYWQARVTEGQGQGDAAKKIYEQAAQVSPYSYYGFMALKKIQGSAALPQTPTVPPEWKLSAVTPSGGSKGVAAAATWGIHFKKAEALARVGLGQLSQTELEAALKQSEGDAAALAQLLEAGRKTQEYFISVLLGQKYWDRFKSLFATPKAADNYRNHLQYPFAYRAEVEKAAARSAIPAALVVGLMRQESGFMPWIISGANAQGLMQLLPATANSRAKAMGIGAGDLLDPDYNIMLGAAELKEMLQRFSDNWPQAMAAYNAGPGNARKWAEQSGNLSMDEWIEEIPFAETNLYVKLVLRNYWSYQTLYSK